MTQPDTLPTRFIWCEQCVDTRTDIEQCGGCTGHRGGTGADCTLIEHARDVRCFDGRCRVGEAQRAIDYDMPIDRGSAYSRVRGRLLRCLRRMRCVALKSLHNGACICSF